MQIKIRLDGLKTITNNTARKARIIYCRKLLRARKQLIKATLLLSITPIIVISIMLIYQRLTLAEGLFGTCLVIICSIFFAKPYMEDLSSLTNYVQQLAQNKHVKTPPLSFLGNVEELSSAVSSLQHSWEEKKIQLEAAIAESSILVDTIPDILMMLGRDMRILRANKAAEALFGRKIKNEPFSKIVDEPMLREQIALVMDNKKCGPIEFSITSHNIKRDFQINIEKFPLFSIGGIAVVLIMHDVTAAKRTRQMLKDFVANASHEIRTPLTSISGFIENLRDMEEDRETRKQFLEIMSEQAERMGILVNDLLSLSKVEMNESTIPTDKIDISPLIVSTIRRLENLAADKNMKIILNSESDLPEILGDSNEISQVVTNLISNAIKYGYENTDIIVKANIVSDCNILNKPGKYITLCVSDKGEGIPQEHLPRITERFYRVDKARSKAIGGTGLGLAIVKHILNRHRGELIIESVEGEGSSFTAYLPVDD